MTEERNELDRIADHIAGCIYGCAIGDALGLPAEWRSSDAAISLSKRSGGKWPNEFIDTPVRNNRDSWAAGEWSDDTSMSLCVIDAFLDSIDPDQPLKFSPQLVAKHFKRWFDEDPKGTGKTTRTVISHPFFLPDPHGVAHEVWEAGGRQSASNGAVMRAAAVGICRPSDLDWTAEASAMVAKVTHADPRCVASAVAISVATAALVNGHASPRAMQLGLVASTPYCDLEPLIGVDGFIYKARSVNELQLDEKDRYGFTFKAMTAGFWGLSHSLLAWLSGAEPSEQDCFGDPLKKIVLAGGDTDTNGAVTGALLGACFGIDAIPERWVKGLKNRSALDSRIAALMALAGDSC